MHRTPAVCQCTHTCERASLRPSLMAVPQHPTGALPGQHGHGRRGQGCATVQGLPSPPTPDHGPPPWPGCLHGGPSMSPSLSQVRFIFSAGSAGPAWEVEGPQLCPHLCPKENKLRYPGEGLGAILGAEAAASQSLRVEMVLEPPGLVLPQSSPSLPDTSHALSPRQVSLLDRPQVSPSPCLLS